MNIPLDFRLRDRNNVLPSPHLKLRPRIIGNEKG